MTSPLAHIELDFLNYADPHGHPLENVVESLIDGLDVSIGLRFIGDGGLPMIEFIGLRQELVTLIDRYEEDRGLAAELYDEIEDYR